MSTGSAAGDTTDDLGRLDQCPGAQGEGSQSLHPPLLGSLLFGAPQIGFEAVDDQRIGPDVPTTTASSSSVGHAGALRSKRISRENVAICRNVRATLAQRHAFSTLSSHEMNTRSTGPVPMT
jgi:hypothetical protein